MRMTLLYFAIQAQQVFYVDDYNYGMNWKVVQKVQHRNLWDIPEMEDREEDDDSNHLYQENESTQNDWIVKDDELEVLQFHRSDVNPDLVDASAVKGIDNETQNDNIDDDEEDETLHEYYDEGDSAREDYDDE